MPGSDIENLVRHWPYRFNLKTAVEGEKDVQDIDVHGRFEKLAVTLLVMRAFSNFPGALRACGYFRHPTAVFRIMDHPCEARAAPPRRIS
jgi:hypothetical protein